MNTPIVPRIWSNELLSKFFDQAAVPFVINDSYQLDGHPVIDTLPETYHDHAQFDAQRVTSIVTSIVTTVRTRIDAQFATGFEFVADDSDGNPVEVSSYTDAIDKLPWWPGTSTDGQPAAGEHAESGDGADARAGDPAVSSDDAVTFQLYPRFGVTPYDPGPR